jgi:hypothetical protein
MFFEDSRLSTTLAPHEETSYDSFRSLHPCSLRISFGEKEERNEVESTESENSSLLLISKAAQ